MDKHEFLNQALRSDIWKDSNWIVTLLSYTLEEQAEAPRLFDIRYDGNKASFFSESGWVELDGVYDQRGVFIFNEHFKLQAGVIENCKEDINTTAGLAIINKIALADVFKDKIPYINRRFSPGDIESRIGPKLKDTPLDGVPRKDDLFYVDELIKYNDALLFLSQLTLVCTPGVTEKAITPPPTAKEVLNKLVEENKDRLNDPVVITEIGAQLEKIDAEYLKGDRSLGFLINKKKDLQIVRKKQYLTYGVDGVFDEKDPISFIPAPLFDGVDYTKIHYYNNGSRLGSFSRGSETQLGGVTAKEILRASSNAEITIEDCGTTLGMEEYITETNIKEFRGLFVQTENGPVQITPSNEQQFINKSVIRRSPAFCRNSSIKYCAKCCGGYLSLHEKGLSAALVTIGGIFLNSFLKSMHGKVAESVTLDFDKLIS